MKPTAVLIFGLLATAFVHAQSLSSRTNDLNLSLSGTGLPNSGELPSIEWVSPTLEHTMSNESKIRLKARITSKSPLRELKVQAGDKSSGFIYVTKVLQTADNITDYAIDQAVTLPNGSNFVEIVAVNNDGATISSDRNIVVGGDAIADAVMIDRQDYALMFLTDKYDHWTDLVNPIADGRRIAKELTEKYGFQVDIVENPTVEMVYEKLRDYNTMKFKPQDQLLIFFAGHGQYDETFGEGYVVAKNTLKNDPSKNTYISHNRLRGVVNNIPSHHTFIVMDVCFGGTFDSELTRTRSGADYNDATTSQIIARKLSYKTRKYLTSGGKEYVSDGIPGKHSPFAAKFIESLSTFGGDDGILTIAEMMTSFEKLKQLPRIGGFGTDEPLSDFLFIAKNRFK